MKKTVIAYLHTHWDKEWYRPFEVFRLRLLRVFDNVLKLLDENKIPSFYFDGQVNALLDYLELRPEKEKLVRKFIKEKRLFIGPCYTLVDEFLTDKPTFYKNLEIGLKISRNFGCTDFIGYLADTFGHSQNIPKAFKHFGIDKCIVWRGVGDLPSEFIFNGIDTVNLVRGYFNDIFSSKLSLDDKAKFVKKELDLISEKSGRFLLMPIGADHLGIESDIQKQIDKINDRLEDYTIKLSTPFEYFDLVKNNFKTKFNNELRDNSKTFILPGCYSSRRDLKQLNTECSYKLQLAENFSKQCNQDYKNIIEYAYKLLLQNEAHDGICGCAVDEVHQENITRYKKILEITDTIIGELKLKGYKLNLSNNIEEIESKEICKNAQVISTNKGFESELLYNTQRIPITEDFTTLYTQIKEKKETTDILKVTDSKLSNNQISLEVKNGKIWINSKYSIDFVRCKDIGDSYNFAPDIKSKPKNAKIISSKVAIKGNLRVGIEIKTDFYKVLAFLNKGSSLINFEIKWNNRIKNNRWQVQFNMPKPISETYSEDMNEIINRKFNPDYDIRKNLPKTKGIEAKTNTAPMQRFVWTQDFGIITKGLTEYEVFKKSLNITILRSVSMLSNPKNPARTTPAGPPLPLFDGQLLGKNKIEFAIGNFELKDSTKYIDEIYPKIKDIK